jgi:oligoribonuclease NrnB/cAMP/cGMP phosphodiesterase (DHH superfamily)
VRRICFYHAGCPDGFGAAWAVWRAWGDDADYRPIGHDEPIDVPACAGAQVAFVDIFTRTEILRALGERAGHVIVLDHHVTSRDRLQAEPALERELRARGHHVRFDLSHSGAVLAWQHFHEDDPPTLLEYVEDQDLWAWKLPHSEEVNAAIGSHVRTFDAWERQAAKPLEALVAEGEPLVRSARIEVERAIRKAHAITVRGRRVEAVNATAHRSAIGHALSERAAFGPPWGCVYRVSGSRVDATLYSIGELDVARVAVELGGGGHRNAAGFSVPLREWMERFL